MPTYELFSSTEVLGSDGDGTDAVGPVDPPVSVGLEPIGESVTKAAAASLHEETGRDPRGPR